MRRRSSVGVVAALAHATRAAAPSSVVRSGDGAADLEPGAALGGRAQQLPLGLGQERPGDEPHVDPGVGQLEPVGLDRSGHQRRAVRAAAGRDDDARPPAGRGRRGRRAVAAGRRSPCSGPARAAASSGGRTPPGARSAGRRAPGSRRRARWPGRWRARRTSRWSWREATRMSRRLQTVRVPAPRARPRAAARAREANFLRPNGNSSTNRTSGRSSGVQREHLPAPEVQRARGAAARGRG